MKIGIFIDEFNPITTEHLKIIKQNNKFDEFFMLPEAYSDHIVNMIKLVLPNKVKLWNDNFKKNRNFIKNLKEIENKFLNAKITIFLDYQKYNNHKLVKKINNNFSMKFLNKNSNKTQLSPTNFIDMDLKILDKKVCKYMSDNFLYANEIIKHKLSHARYYHSYNVANLAHKLAKIHNVNPQKAWAAGIFHDITKELSDKEQESILKKYKVKYDWPKPVKHQMTGALWFKHVYGSKDLQIFSAISKHTTGSKDMTLFDKVVYMADVLSKDRNFKNIKRERKILFKDFNEAFLRALSRMEAFTMQKHKVMDKRAKDIVKHHLK